MEFKWDEDKNQANIREHGINFETAKLIFGGKFVKRQDRRLDYGEARYISIGNVEGAVIVVAHTDRGGRTRISTRIISARPASRKERQAYHERLR